MHGYQVVAPDVSAQIRKVVTPKDILENRLPQGLSVFEADAILAGAAAYAKPNTLSEGVGSQTVIVTVRLIDLGTGQATATTQATGVGLGMVDASRMATAAKKAIGQLFKGQVLPPALKKVGQSGGSVTLVVQGLPDRGALVELRQGLEQAFAGAPAKEVYFAEGLGKLMLGGSRSSTAMKGPQIADMISQNRNLALEVIEVANTRIVARYDRSRTVQIHALVLEPKLAPYNQKQATQLGKFVATQMATFEFARASYQRGRMSRKVAIKRAKRVGADVVVESEVLRIGKSAALVMRVIDVKSGRPILRHQQVLERESAGLQAARALLAELRQNLPNKVAQRPAPVRQRSLNPNPTAAAPDGR